ncbi:MAG: neutral zinc metallopeptidase [Cyanobacteriota bacterium]|nr:neutral zinc metallopeptidase [Cyanobacteriota bacterium]
MLNITRSVLSNTACRSGWMPQAMGMAVVGLCLMMETPAARGSGQGPFIDALEEMRSHDGVVRDVRYQVVSSAGARTGCGAVENGDLVVFYCPRDRAVYAISASLDLVRREFGVPGIRYLAAHEMAHGRQHAVSGFSRSIVKTSVLDELQADCIAGAYLNQIYGYTANSATGEQLKQFAYSIGDRNFLHKDWHGNPRLRVAALTRGLNQGDPARCLSSSRFNYGTLLEQGANWLRRFRER